MKLSGKKTEKEELAEKPVADDMSELKKFIQKQRLQNKILKKIADDLQSLPAEDLNKPKSA